MEEVEIAQKAVDREFASLVQLLDGQDGKPLVRFAYTTDGSVRRGPVTFRGEDLEALRVALRTRRRLARCLMLGRR